VVVVVVSEGLADAAVAERGGRSRRCERLIS
jgi:uncharacterized protein YjaZ